MLRKLVLACLMLATFSGMPVHANALSVGQPAPDIKLTMVDGRQVQLSQLKGQVVVLNLWATWCVPCRKELPTLDTYYRIQKKHGLEVFAATTEDSVPQARLKTLFAAMAIHPLRRLPHPYTPVRGAVPTNYVIDRKGIVRYAAAGAFDLDSLNRILVPLLEETAGAA